MLFSGGMFTTDLNSLYDTYTFYTQTATLFDIITIEGTNEYAGDYRVLRSEWQDEHFVNTCVRVSDYEHLSRILPPFTCPSKVHGTQERVSTICKWYGLKYRLPNNTDSVPQHWQIPSCSLLHLLELFNRYAQFPSGRGTRVRFSNGTLIFYDFKLSFHSKVVAKVDGQLLKDVQSDQWMEQTPGVIDLYVSSKMDTSKKEHIELLTRLGGGSCYLNDCTTFAKDLAISHLSNDFWVQYYNSHEISFSTIEEPSYKIGEVISYSGLSPLVVAGISKEITDQRAPSYQIRVIEPCWHNK